MPVTVIQGQDQAAGHALLGVSRPGLPDPAGLHLRVTGMQGGGEQHLDPGKHEGAAWSPAETWFPVEAEAGQGGDLLIELGPAATWHLQPYQPYMLALRFADGSVIEERMSWNAIRLPSNPPPVMAAPVVATPAPEPEPAQPDPLEAFADMEEEAPVSPEPVPEPQKSRPVWVWIVGLLLIWAIIGALVWYFVLREPAAVEPEPEAEPVAESEPQPAPEPEVQEDTSIPLTVDGARAFIRDQQPDAAAAFAEAGRFAAGGQHAAAFLLYKHAARKGSAAAAHQMGRYYDPKGFDAALGVISQPEARIAADWYEQAAREGHVPAMSRLGEMLKTGEITPPDAPEQAVFWLRKAAEAGDSAAKQLLEE